MPTSAANGGPAIEVLESDLGIHRVAASLNPDLPRDGRLLRLTLRIRWDPEKPTTAFGGLLDRAHAAFPGLRRHECRGPAEYRVPAPPPEDADLDPGLAVAHLLEHLMVETIASVSQQSRVSGATGARGDAADRYDVFVDCGDAALARLAIRLGIASLTVGLDGARAQTILVLSRRLRRRWPGAVPLRVPPRASDGAEDAMGRSAVWLESCDFARRVPETVNLSGLAYYRAHVR